MSSSPNPTLLAQQLARECKLPPATQAQIASMRYNESLGEDSFEYSDCESDEDSE